MPTQHDGVFLDITHQDILFVFQGDAMSTEQDRPSRSDAIAKIFHDYQTRFRVLAASILGPQNADDAVQTLLLKLHQSRVLHDNPAWRLVVARNTFLDIRRKNKRLPEDPWSENPPDRATPSF